MALYFASGMKQSHKKIKRKRRKEKEKKKKKAINNIYYPLCCKSLQKLYSKAM